LIVYVTLSLYLKINEKAGILFRQIIFFKNPFRVIWVSEGSLVVIEGNKINALYFLQDSTVTDSTDVSSSDNFRQSAMLHNKVRRRSVSCRIYLTLVCLRASSMLWCAFIQMFHM
jgi:hypothetical protein